jgi:hypothetical protein
MSIHLTPQQQQALDTQGDSPPRVIDPRTNTNYILVREVDYESIRELLEDERRQQAIQAEALRNAAGRINDTPGVLSRGGRRPSRRTASSTS